MKTCLLLITLLLPLQAANNKYPTVGFAIDMKYVEYWVLNNCKEYKKLYLLSKESGVNITMDYCYAEKHLVRPPKLELIGVAPYDK